MLSTSPFLDLERELHSSSSFRRSAFSFACCRAAAAQAAAAIAAAASAVAWADAIWISASAIARRRADDVVDGRLILLIACDTVSSAIAIVGRAAAGMITRGAVLGRSLMSSSSSSSCSSVKAPSSTSSVATNAFSLPLDDEITNDD
jgi:hypothetical protein